MSKVIIPGKIIQKFGAIAITQVNSQWHLYLRGQEVMTLRRRCCDGEEFTDYMKRIWQTLVNFATFREVAQVRQSLLPWYKAHTNLISDSWRLNPLFRGSVVGKPRRKNDKKK